MTAPSTAELIMPHKHIIQRLLDHPALDAQAKQVLKAQHDSLNSFVVRAEIERQLRLLFKSVSVNSNVRQRL